MLSFFENLRLLVSDSLGEYQVLAASLPDIWTILIIPAAFGILYCFFGCKRWMRRLLGACLGLAICSLLTFALAPRLFDLSPTMLLVYTVVAGLLGALIFGFGNVIVEFLAYFMVFRFALQLLTGLGTTACVIIAAVLAWAICLVFVKNRMVPTAVAGAALCGLASMYFGNIYLSVGVFLVLLVLGILTQRALIKASKAKEGEAVDEAAAGEAAAGAAGEGAVAEAGTTEVLEATEVLETQPDLADLPIITEEDAATQVMEAVVEEEPETVPFAAVVVEEEAEELPEELEPVTTQVLEAFDEPGFQMEMAEEAYEAEDDNEDGFVVLERNVTFDDLWSGEQPVRTKTAAVPSLSSSKVPTRRKAEGETRGTLVAATALVTTVLTIISMGLLKTFKKD